MNSDKDLQREITRAALGALRGTPFALAGYGAIREHGILDRPTQDVDLFTSEPDAAQFDSAVVAVLSELRALGHTVEEIRRAAQFARLHVTTIEGRFVEIDMGVDSREAEAVALALGPVLALEDAVGNKVGALYSRAEARDYVDVDAIRVSGKFTDVGLVDAAHARDLGFEVPMFLTQLDRAQSLRPDQVASYGVDPSALKAMKARFNEWAAELRGMVSPPLNGPSAREPRSEGSNELRDTARITRKPSETRPSRAEMHDSEPGPGAGPSASADRRGPTL